jgi:hypothetical protein
MLVNSDHTLRLVLLEEIPGKAVDRAVALFIKEHPLERDVKDCVRASVLHPAPLVGKKSW